MVFGMFSSQGTSPLVRLQTRVNVQVYNNRLEGIVLPNIVKSGVLNPIFMQDNATSHKAKTAARSRSY